MQIVRVHLQILDLMEQTIPITRCIHVNSTKEMQIVLYVAVSTKLLRELCTFVFYFDSQLYSSEKLSE